MKIRYFVKIDISYWENQVSNIKKSITDSSPKIFNWTVLKILLLKIELPYSFGSELATSLSESSLLLTKKKLPDILCLRCVATQKWKYLKFLIEQFDGSEKFFHLRRITSFFYFSPMINDRKCVSNLRTASFKKDLLVFFLCFRVLRKKFSVKKKAWWFDRECLHW